MLVYIHFLSSLIRLFPVEKLNSGAFQSSHEKTEFLNTNVQCGISHEGIVLLVEVEVIF